MNLVEDIWDEIAWLLDDRNLRAIAMMNKQYLKKLCNHPNWYFMLLNLISRI
jgi:hypothetical protein